MAAAMEEGKGAGEGKGKGRARGVEKTLEASGAAQEGDAGALEAEGGGTTSGGGTPEQEDKPLLPSMFEEFGEVVWKPKDLARDEEKSRSSFLERVPPVHTEKALRALHQARHNTRMAEKLLHEQHGISLPPPEKQAELSSGDGPQGTGGGGGGGGGGSEAEALIQHGIRLSPPKKQVESAANRAPETSGGGGGGGGANVSTQRQDYTKATGDYTKAEVERAKRAFIKHGRNLDAVKMELGWTKSAVVEYYYHVWKRTTDYLVSEAILLVVSVLECTRGWGASTPQGERKK